MKEKIIELLGKNHKDPIDFQTSYDQVYGLYTFKGDVYVLKQGMDLDFEEDLTEKEQKKVLELVLSKKWIVNPSLQ